MFYISLNSIFEFILKQVVDARIGPGIKSMTKFKKRKEEQLQSQNGSTEFAGQSSTNAQNIRNNSMAERFGKIFKKKKKTTTITTRSCDENVHPASPSSSSSENDDNRMSDDALDRLDNLECDEEMGAMDDEMGGPRRAQRKQKNPIKNRSNMVVSTTHVIDSDLWKQRKTCCGMLYENKKLGAILLETNEYSMASCSVHAKKLPLITSTKTDELMKLPTAIKSLPPKKQHFLRQCIIETAPPAIAQMPIEQSAPIDYSKPSAIDSARILSHSLHKIRNDANGKVTKKAPKKKLAELNAAKNLIKLCTSNAKATLAAPNGSENKYREQIAANEHNENKNITNTVCPTTESTTAATPKYSDNSSDSGYEETLHDATQLNQIAKIGATRPIILSNGVKLHVKPENLVMAANLAGVSQTAIQTTQVSVLVF